MAVNSTRTAPEVRTVTSDPPESSRGALVNWPRLQGRKQMCGSPGLKVPMSKQVHPTGQIWGTLSQPGAVQYPTGTPGCSAQ
jgi:hypothetical protein